MASRVAVIRALLFGGGLWLGLSSGDAPVPLPELAPSTTGWLTTPTRDLFQDGGREDRRSWSSQLAREEDSLRAQVDDLMGEPMVWPDEPPHEMTEGFFEESLLADFLQKLDRAPAVIDCQAYPCLVVFADPLEEDEEERFLDAVRGRNELFRAWGKSRVEWTSEWGINNGPDGMQWNLFGWSLLPDDASEDLRDQVKIRLQLQMIAQRRQNGLAPTEL